MWDNPVDYERKIGKAKEAEKDTAKEVAPVEEQQEDVREAIRGIGKVYHPFDLETGAIQSSEEIAVRLDKHFSEIEKVAEEQGFSERCLKLIEKAYRVVEQMVATISLFFRVVEERVGNLSLPYEIKEAIHNSVIPGMYLKHVARKAKLAEGRARLRKISEELLKPFMSRAGPFEHLDDEQLRVVEQVGTECAELLQRSSSCVEGRNGQLSFRHHGLHRISGRKLHALTTVHNFFVKRFDGTTAAERLFGEKPRDLFCYLLDNVDLPARPAQKRSEIRLSA